ncbi:MAG: tetratricopeptide repeat protein [Treponema sp.]|nr:tetratricopeptide repeat protein [Treponema sp.]
MTRILTFLILTSMCLYPVALEAEVLPHWMIPLRDSIYEQELTADEIVPLYNAAKAASAQNFTGADLNLLLSRCEFFMGRAYLFEERNSEAHTHFSEGLRIAENLIKTDPSSTAWVLRAENLSHLCQISTVAFVIGNGLNIENYAKTSLRYNSRNATAQYVVAARWVYAPAPFSNHRRGIEMMSAIIENGDMERDDRFNVLSAIGYAYLQQKKYDEARTWFLKSLEVYPTNKFVNGLLKSLN